MKELAIGQAFKENDPRVGTRIYIIEMLDEKYAYLYSRFHPATKTRIARRRMYTDDKRRRTGWSITQ